MKKPWPLRLRHRRPLVFDVHVNPPRLQVVPYRSTRACGSIAVSPWQVMWTRPVTAIS
jgi:hypothetical protein